MKPADLFDRLRAEGVHKVAFQDFVVLLKVLGFNELRSRSSHHIFGHPQVRELMNIQNVKGKVKPYQARQLMKLVDEYNLSVEDTE